jgi:hypothetical protein
MMGQRFGGKVISTANGRRKQRRIRNRNIERKQRKADGMKKRDKL